MTGIRRAALAALLVFTAPACSPGTSSTLQRTPALDSIAATGVATGIPGIAVALVRPDGSISAGAAGVADRRTGQPFTPGSHIHAGSTTKAVTAAAVLLLVDRGELSLADTVANLVRAAVVERIPYANRMTVLQLLEHRTGLYSPNNDPTYLARYIGPERTEFPFWTAEEIAGFAADPSNIPLFEPGEGQAYGDINYVLLGLIVRDVAGEPFKDFVRREIFRPLGMRDSWYLSDRPDAARARGYTMDSEILRSIGLDPALEADEDGYIDTTDAQERSDGAAGIITTVVDLGRFAHAVTQIDFLSTESRALFHAAAERIRAEDDDEALGILRGYALDGRRLLTSEGDGPGTNVIWALDVDTGRIAVGAANLFGRWDEADLLLNELIPAVLAVD